MIAFDPYTRIDLIVIVGLGGTGSQLARSIARMLYDMRRRSITTPKLLFVDPDVIEEKNVGRQMFVAADVGGNKAEVLARRFSYALGIDVAWRNEPLSRDWFKRYSSITGETTYQANNTLLCGAVDGHAGRVELAAIDGLWIDAGNHFASGQVVIGNTAKWDYVRRGLEDAAKDTPEHKTRYLPNAAALFPALLEPEVKAQPDLSCADLVSIGEQHLLINDFVANAAAQYVYKLLHRQPIHSFMTYVDIEGLSMRSIPITQENIDAYMRREEVA